MTAMRTEIMDGAAMQRTLKRMAHQIIESDADLDGLILVGIVSRGVSVAKYIAAHIEAIAGSTVPMGKLDITFYRDDLFERQGVAKTSIDFDVNDKKIVLADDVLYTGRTARAAMDAIMDSGRPAYIKLAALVDRGHRELPIKADFVGKNIPTSKDETVKVEVSDFDGHEGVFLCRDAR